MKTPYKPLVSSAPAHSILNAQAFHYTNSVETDIRKTFERIARIQALARAVLNGASNVQPLPLRPHATHPRPLAGVTP